jgi:hypothetical protein
VQLQLKEALAMRKIVVFGLATLTLAGCDLPPPAPKPQQSAGVAAPSTGSHIPGGISSTNVQSTTDARQLQGQTPAHQ